MGREMFNTLRELPAAWIESDNELVGMLKHSLNLTDYSDEIAVAYAFFYCMNTCYSGRVNKRTSFAGGQKGDCADNTIRRYYKARTSLQQFADRFATVYIENLHYEACVRKYDDKETFFYLDPPYSVEVSSGYGTGWSESEEEMLVELLSEIEGSFVLSCYDNERYEGLLECGATRETFNAFSTIAQNGGGATAKRVETIYWRGHGRKQTSQTNLWDWLTMETQ